MSASTPPRPAPAPADERGQPRVGMRALALLVAVVVAVLGVQAAIGSVQRKEYSQARSTTVYFLRNGSAISTSIERLQKINANDRILMIQTRAALDAGNVPRAKRLMAQAAFNNIEQLQLQQEVKAYQEGFDKVFLR